MSGRRKAMDTAMRQTTCWICGSNDSVMERSSGIEGSVTSRDFAITDHRYGVTGSLFRCRNCGFVQCSDADDVLQYYVELEDPAYEEGRDQRALQAHHLLQILYRYAPAGRLLDIGAGSGILVEQAIALGYEAEGVEPSVWLQQKAKERGLKVHLGTYPHEGVLPGFSAVALVDVIEHVPNPVNLLVQTAKDMADDGVGIIVTPDVDSVIARIMGRKWWHYRIAHIGYFSRKTLLLALEKAGLTPVELGRPRWYFSLDYVVQRLNIYLPKVLQIPVMQFMRGVTIRLNFFDSLYVIFKKRPPK